MSEITNFICPRCQKRAVRSKHSGDYEHDCFGSEVLANEDVLVLGDWQDYTNDNTYEFTYQGILGSGAIWNAGSVTKSGIDFSQNTNAVAVIDHNSNLSLENHSAFSWSFWTKLNSNNNNVLPRFIEKAPHYMATMGDPTNGKYRMIAIEMVQSGTNLPEEFWGNTQLSTGIWYHIVGCYDKVNNVGSIYVNGTAETVTKLLAWSGTQIASTGSRNFLFGNRNAGSRNLDGTMDNIYYYNRFLTSSEVGSLYSNIGFPTDAIGSWALNEGTGSVFNQTITLFPAKVQPGVLQAGQENKLQGTRAGLEGARDYSRTSRGFRKGVYRTRRHIEHISEDNFKHQGIADRQPVTSDKI